METDNALSSVASPLTEGERIEVRGFEAFKELRFLRFCGQGLFEIESKSPYAKQQQQILAAV